LTAYRKKLIEVALPLEAINAESAREKSIRHGHPSTLHLWWARRPLAACRAVLFASLVDDPSALPEQFPTLEVQEAERQRLFRIIEKMVKWENVNNEEVMDAARAEIMRSTGGNPPPVLDPFCGGGSIPLEAQRLGLEAHASDLNPVAVLITKALIEIPPKFANLPPVHPGDKMARTWKGAQGLAEDVRYYGKWMRDEAFKRIGHLYPKVRLPKEHGGGEATVIAWIWARTVTCPNPACGARMPLISSFALSTKKGKEAWVEPLIDQAAKTVRFTVKSGAGTLPDGTVNRNGARCIVCEMPVPFEYVRAEGKAGRLGAQMIAIVAEGQRGRTFVPPAQCQEAIAQEARSTWQPDTSLPDGALGFRVQSYGMTKHSHLFSGRQLVALTTFSDLVSEARQQVLNDALSDAKTSNGYTRMLLPRIWRLYSARPPTIGQISVSGARIRRTWVLGMCLPVKQSKWFGIMLKRIHSANPQGTGRTQQSGPRWLCRQYRPRAVQRCFSMTALVFMATMALD
jgi:putative DNA methylase